MRGFGIAGVALAAGMLTAAAQEQSIAQERIAQESVAQDMKSPRISHARVDWEAAHAELGTIEALRSAVSPGEQLASLNRAMGERFARIAASPVPVLLPFDTATYLRDRTAGNGSDAAAAADTPTGNYLAGFQGAPFFHAGPAGYDAVVLARTQELGDLGFSFPHPIYVIISGSALLYELDEPAGMIGWPVTGGLDLEFPGIKRLFLENYVRYTFVRYGVPYAVSISCFDGGARFRMVSCRNADKVAVRIIKALRLAGGTPARHSEPPQPSTIERPDALSTVFTYHSPGRLLPGTGFKGRTGVADTTVYSKIRFPMADAPSFANSQSFMNWGNCEATGRRGAGLLGRVAAYRCRVNSRPLISDESAAENYSYPWRDNFCEHRFFYVGQCPGGLGHQGQDIRPSSCKQRAPGANRCEPYQHDVVAVRDGAVLRAPGQDALYIVVNAPNERIRFRYLHMQPKQFDANGLVSGRFVREGEVIGKVGNYFKRERATTYHLHFDAQVPTKYGWVFVNPYMTLVAAYERQIRGRGQEIKQEITDDLTASVTAPQQTPSAPPAPAALEQSAPALAPPATIAAKPSEIRVESPPTERVDSEVARQ